ncbi:hypothetical protein B0J11DRAFT_508827 [Dendryphion nanum]|uniref:MACPF domain-containing protein n=1 Tax=Dendryphion nanum TaxID=256645 RepID=A0A9P9DGX8_9PLEO|nr:hypothetical protein B0J11DRAFT_508827 [Dendryphion nanum]
MALSLAPYNDSMRLGMGFNSYTQTLCIDQAVEVGKDSVKTIKSDNTSQVVSYSSRFVEKLSDVVDSMNISYGSSIKKGTVEISGNTSSVSEDKIKSSDLNAIVSVKVVNQTTTLVDDCKFKPIPSIKPNSPNFNDVYGDCYISGFIEGGDFTGLVSMKVLDRTKTDQIVSSIKSSMGSGSKQEFTLDSMESSINGSVNANLKNTETTISVNWMGGGQIKTAEQLWDMDTMFAAAAAFPSQVAQCPQRTWAILTKYKANRDFVVWAQDNGEFTPLDYENVTSFTGELFENFMEYKQLLKKLQHVLQNREHYVVKDVYNAITLDVPTLIAVRGAMRNEMSKIVEGVDILAKDPGVLKRHKELQVQPTNSVVQGILLEAENGRLGKHPSDKASPGPVRKIQAQAASGPKLGEVSFDFGLLIAPEIWSDHMPIHKDDIDDEVPPTGPPTAPPTEGFPPPPEVNPQDPVQSPTPTPTPIPEQPPTRDALRIIGASYGGKDVTADFRRLITGQTWDINTGTMGGLTDPWPGHAKSFSVLYSYPDVPDAYGVLTAGTGMEYASVSITPNKFKQALALGEALDKTGAKPGPFSTLAIEHNSVAGWHKRRDGLRILAVIWGPEQIFDVMVLEDIHQTIIHGYPIDLTTLGLFPDTWRGAVKTCTIFYQYIGGDIQMANAKEGEKLYIK